MAETLAQANHCFSISPNTKSNHLPEDVNDALMGWDRSNLKTKMMGIPSPQECVGTNTDRAYGTVPPPGSKIDTASSADAGVTGSILATQCAAGRSSYADAAEGRNSYANAARRALKLRARSAKYLNNPSY
jgi:hypothetical protein